MNDEVFRANNDKVLQAFAKREFLNHWHAFSVYCMEVALAFIHFYENEHGGDLPPGLESGELARKDVHVNERLTRRDVEDYRDGYSISQDFQTFYNELHGDIHAKVADRQRKVDEARADLQAAQVEIARLQQELRTVSERCQQDVQREKDASKRISEAFGTETADLKAKLQRLEALVGGEAAKSSEILAGFQEDRRKADEVRVRFMGELDRLKTLDLKRVPELSHEILRLQDMVMGSRDFESVIEGYAAKQKIDQALLAAAQKEVDNLKESNMKLQQELDKLNAAQARPSAGAGLPDSFLAVLKSYSEHCTKFDQFGDDTFQFASKKIENADFDSLDKDLKKVFSPIMEYVKGSLFTVHIMQNCVQASNDGRGVVQGYYDQLNIIGNLYTAQALPAHFRKKHWKDFWHCILGMGTLEKYNLFMESLRAKFGFPADPLNPKNVFRIAHGTYFLFTDPNFDGVDSDNSVGLADKVMRVFEVKQVAVQQLILNILTFSQTLLTFLEPTFKFRVCVDRIQEELKKRAVSLFRVSDASLLHEKINKFHEIFTLVCTQENLFTNPTFPMWLFTSGFFITPIVNTPRCIVSKNGTSCTQSSSVDFTTDLQNWFGKYISDPDNNQNIDVVEAFP